MMGIQRTEGGGRPCVFFDLQGTLGGPPGGDVTDFAFYPWGIEALRLLGEHSVMAAILTNQSRVSKGLVTMERCREHAERILREIKGQGCPLGGLYICPHSAKDGCDCRKPKPGLALRAALELGVALGASYMIGDIGKSDMLLAREIGSKAILVKTGFGRGSLAEFRSGWADAQADYIAENALDAARWALWDMGTSIQSK